MASPPGAGGPAAASAAPPAAGAKPKVLILTGPTAVGKTRVALALAERLNGEIISADSVQVYCGLDIGSDKITPAERRGVPHHLLDILQPDQDFSAGEFFAAARRATEEVLARGRTPIVAGGTGFYLRWYTLGKPATPPGSRASAAAAESRLSEAYAAAEGAAGRALSEVERWKAGVGVVSELGDAASAERLRGEPNNLYRLHRVVDILLQSPGRTLAQLDMDRAPAAAALDYDFRTFFLNRPRAQLYRRIDARVEAMVAKGLLGEAGRELAARGLEPNTNCATRAIGYRQALEFLAQCRDQGDGKEALSEAGVVQLVRDMQAASRKLCHHQLSWFRDDAMYRWVDAAQGEEAAVEAILEAWDQPVHSGGECAGRLTSEEQLEMKRYVARLERFTPGSGAVAAALEEARAVLGMSAASACLSKGMSVT